MAIKANGTSVSWSALIALFLFAVAGGGVLLRGEMTASAHQTHVSLPGHSDTVAKTTENETKIDGIKEDLKEIKGELQQIEDLLIEILRKQPEDTEHRS